jgi:hypothetical protein
MAGVVPIIPPRTGFTDGRLNIKIEKFIPLGELLNHVSTARAFLNELSKKGWRYFFIDGYGMGLWELEVPLSPYGFQINEHPRGGFAYTMAVDFGRCLPKLRLKDVLNLQRFVVNISSQYYPRAVTVDLTQNKITYVNESLWVSKGKGCKKEATEVLKILQWLIEEKKFKLEEAFGNRKYLELVILFGKQRQKKH